MSSNTNIGNTPVNQGYVQLIHTGETGGIDGTLRTLYDGDGTASDLQIASNKVKISTELFIGSKTITEFVQDVVGDMFDTNGSHTNITASYDDNGDGAIDLVSTGEVTLTGTQTLSNKTLTSPIIDSVTISTIQTGSESFADNDTSLMTSAAINDKIGTEVASLVDSAPDDLNTLNELAAALGDDENFATTVTNNIATKLAKASNLSDLASASTARSNLGVDAAGTDNSTNVTLAGSLDYITLSGQEITRNAINLTTDVTGALPIANGGTGATSDSAARSALGLGSLATLNNVSVSNFNDAALQTSSESFGDNDTSVMTSAAIQDKIESFGYTTNTGDMTGVSITASNPLDISQSNTTSGNYSATISLDASEFQGYLTDMADNNLGADELLIIDSGDTTLKRKAISEIRLTTFNATGFSSGISFDGSTANGVLTFKDSDEATVESSLTFNGSTLSFNTSTANRNIEVGAGATANINSFIDLIGDTTYTDYGARFIRTNGGANANTDLRHRGTGSLNINAQDGGQIVFMTQGTERLKVNSTGHTMLAATKALYFDGGSDTYIQEDADDRLRFFVGGAEFMRFTEDTSDTLGLYTNNTVAMTIDNSQRVGIGQSSPTTALEVIGDIKIKQGSSFSNYSLIDATEALLTLETYSINTSSYPADILFKPAGTERMRITDDGFVGIGTSSPRVRLDLGSNGISHLRWGAWSELGELSSHNSLILGNNIYVDGSSAKVRATTSDGYRAITMKYNEGITFHTVQASVSADDAIGNERMRIDQSGNVGIGTASPNRLLHLQSTGDTIMQITSADGSGAFIDLGDVSDVDGGRIVYDSGSNLLFNTASTERVRIDSSGNVGIGTSSPSAYLHTEGASNGTESYAKFSTGSAAGDQILTIKSSSSRNHMALQVNTGAGATDDLALNPDGGNVGIGTTSPNMKLNISHGDQDGLRFNCTSTTGEAFIDFGDSGDNDAGSIRYDHNDNSMKFRVNASERARIVNTGAFHVTNDVVAFSSTPSDQKLKTNVKDIEYGLDTIMKLKPKQYDWKKDNRKDIGFIAQEVEEVIPEIVKDNEWFDDKIKTMDYEKLTAVLIKAVQEQQKQIEELKNG